ncbi:MAG: peptidylprolyl isomerase [Deltaproteobacteria bacterium]|nr:peptidylprolyl isomerase [Deltaproteobacteria bacterium]
MTTWNQRLLCLALALGLGLPAAASAEQVIDRVVAVVGRKVVTLSEVETRVQLSRQLGTMAGSDTKAQQRRALQELIDEALLEAEVEGMQIEVADAEVEAAITELRRQNGLDEASFARAIAMQGYTLDAYRKEVAAQLRRARLINSEVRSKVQISDADIDGVLRQRGTKESFEIRARHILLKVDEDAPAAEAKAVEEKLLGLLAKVRAEEVPFDELARAESQDGTAKDGGDLGWFGRGLMVPPFEEAAFGAEPGTIVGPVRTRFGYHLIQVLARREKAAKSKDAERQAARAELYGKAFEAEMQRYLEHLREGAVIEIKVAELATP